MLYYTPLPRFARPFVMKKKHVHFLHVLLNLVHVVLVRILLVVPGYLFITKKIKMARKTLPHRNMKSGSNKKCER